MVGQFQYHFPRTTEEIDQAASAFQDCSAHNVLQGCVACLDGLLLRIQPPSADETGHVKSYFSGHYQTYGINVQAACDRHGRFVFASLAAPGGANDIAAFRRTGLSDLIEALPIGKYVVGDNAYICTEHLLTPFSGDQRNDNAKDAYNFYLSQLRIRIEMTFVYLSTNGGFSSGPCR
jgi:DDE superfamily endonuclease